jgi:hypothetical protein
MPFPKGMQIIPWTEEEFNRLQELILETVRNGGTVMEACEKFEEETCRFKWQTIIKPRCDEEYRLAVEMGKDAIAQRSLNGDAPKRRQIRRTVSKVVPLHKDNEQNSDEPLRLTKRDLIRLIRNVEIIDEEAEQLKQEVESLKQQLNDVVRERDELKHKHLLLQSKYNELEVEYNKFLDAFNIARQRVAGIETANPTRTRMVIGKDGFVEKVEVDE